MKNRKMNIKLKRKNIFIILYLDKTINIKYINNCIIYYITGFFIFDFHICIFLYLVFLLLNFLY